MKTPGKIVLTKTEKVGRTYDSKGLINGKIPVYLCCKFQEEQGRKVPIEYDPVAILCSPETLQIVGFID